MRVGIGPSGIGLSEYRCQPGWTVATSFRLTREPALTDFAEGGSSFQETGSGGAAANEKAASAAQRIVFIGLRSWAVGRLSIRDRHMPPAAHAWSCHPAQRQPQPGRCD